MVNVGKTFIAFLLFFLIYKVVIAISYPAVMLFRDDPGWLLYPASVFVAVITSGMGVAISCVLLEKFFSSVSKRVIAVLFIGIESIFIIFGILVYALSYMKEIPIEDAFFDGVVPFTHSFAAILTAIQFLWKNKQA